MIRRMFENFLLMLRNRVTNAKQRFVCCKEKNHKSDLIVNLNLGHTRKSDSNDICQSKSIASQILNATLRITSFVIQFQNLHMIGYIDNIQLIINTSWLCLQFKEIIQYCYNLIMTTAFEEVHGIKKNFQCNHVKVDKSTTAYTWW